MEAKAGPKLRSVEIGANLLGSMYQGEYHGKKQHDPDLKEVLERASAAGCERILVTAGGLAEARAALQLTLTSPMLFSTVGVHPTRAGEFELPKKEEKEGEADTEAVESVDPAAAEGHAQKYLEELLAVAQEGKRLGKVVAIGECGLDYDRFQFCSKEVQLRHFERHFVLTEATGLPMFLHNRNTKGDFAAYIRKHRHRFKDGVVHSFDGPADELKELLDLGLYIGINGCSLRTTENLEVMSQIPLDRLMVETDAPWCDIRPTHAGHKHVKTQWKTVKKEKHKPNDGLLVKSRNEPCCIVNVLEVIAGHRGLPVEQVAEAAFRNSMRVFFPGVDIASGSVGGSDRAAATVASTSS